MTSRTQVDNNRRNARLSTGPRTAAGKKVVAGNARRHGLTGRLLQGSPEDLRAEAMVETWLRGLDHAPKVRTLLRTYAEAQVKLSLIRQRRLLAVATLVHADGRSANVDMTDGAEASDEGRPDGLNLAKLLRYERLARAQRRVALEELERLGLDLHQREEC